MIRVLLVDDSPLSIILIKRMLAKSPEIEIAGTAVNGLEALKLIPRVKPDVVCTDLHMPVMGGLELTKEIMSRHPLPILIVSVSGREGSLSAFKTLEAGAVDIFLKPEWGSDFRNEKSASELIMKIRILSAVHVFKKISPDIHHETLSDMKINPGITLPESPVRIVIIGASTGGPQALLDILTSLPGDFPLPVICIQHISAGFMPGLIDWLSSRCKMKIETAKAGVVPRPGIIYFPGEETQLEIDGAGRFVVSTELPHEGHRPSITVTMKAVAGYFGNSAMGILLTGMGKDGADGLLAIKMAGGVTVAQDEKSCIIFGMPKQAIELGAAGYIVSLNEIGPMILKFSMHTMNRMVKL